MEEDGGAKRREAVCRLVALGRALGLHEECIHDSVQLLDRLSRMGLHLDTLAPSVLGAIALISAKQGVLPASYICPALVRGSCSCRPCAPLTCSSGIFEQGLFQPHTLL